ncbi:MAG: cytochrome c [Terriglobales bacterium]|jgi:mono/diheme cytochrome c family protein
MFIEKLLFMVPALAIFSCTVAAQDQAKDQTQEPPQKVIQHVPMKSTSPVSGKEMYTAYCAVCHGTDGKGAGPAASALKLPSTDLTLLAKNNSGKFPTLKVQSVIHGESAVPAHGSKDMPIWGALFWNMSSGHESEVQQRVANLTRYIESLQAK